MEDRKEKYERNPCNEGNEQGQDLREKLDKLYNQ
jgi:hypothetical protein